MDDAKLRDRFRERDTHTIPPFDALITASPSSRRLRPVIPFAMLGAAACVVAAVVTRSPDEPAASAAELMAWTAATDALMPPDTEPMAFVSFDGSADR